VWALTGVGSCLVGAGGSAPIECCQRKARRAGVPLYRGDVLAARPDAGLGVDADD
jgi:hypothetical protein